MYMHLSAPKLVPELIHIIKRWLFRQINKACNYLIEMQNQHLEDQTYSFGFFLKKERDKES